MHAENTFVTCTQGHRHWGSYGAAGLLLVDPARGVLLQRRAWWTHHGRTWAIPGGALRPGESPEAGAVREAEEEVAVEPSSVLLTASSIVDHGGWRYTTVLGTVTGALDAHVRNRESAEVGWVPLDEVTGYKLHRDFALAWPALRAEAGRRLVLVVDGANVVGSRPDGWWRDRAGAAARLRDKLAVLAGAGMPFGADSWTWWPRVILVVEGQARGVEAVPGVEVVAAERDGDSAIVSVAASVPDGDHVVVATADRELKRRVTEAGAHLMGPSTLLAHL